MRTHRKKYSVNELELLAAVWSIELLKCYLYGRRFTLIADHQALVSALQSNRGKKNYQSLLTRWIDRLITYNFDIQHLAGIKMGLIDYISRYPVDKPQPPAYWDEQFVVALIDDFVTCLESQDSSNKNISLNKNPNGYLGTRKLNWNENVETSISVCTQTAFTVKSQLFQTSRSNKGYALVPQKPQKSYGHRVLGSSYTTRPESITTDEYDKATKMGRCETLL